MSSPQKTESGHADTQILHASAAEALSAALPVSVPVTARPWKDAAGAANGDSATPDLAALAGAADLVVAAFVGSISADLAVHVDTAILGDAADLDPKLVSLDDVLRPAFEAATGVLGAGVLSTVPASAAPALLQDSETALFQLVADDRGVGWFALRLREPASATATDSRTQSGQGTTTAAQHPDQHVTSRLSRLNNVQMALTVEIGRTRVSVRDVLAMEPGAVIELDRNAGAPADVRLNGRLIAQGEVVVMDQDYGVRITKILDSAEGLA
ncbi:flagellar motor switch protein FliN [Nesterenkonia sp. Act20]|uniref:flagellar motor switch protein FliN n=1 Tax=Nesterenkonia sp. Act20 TaxID=1483432 RepID=UPI001C45E3BA|nr:flagellar motor switch protein FliN [Nesterenkonia sp. Act20]